jgi:DNA-binding NarL/FixJ family response regulator
MQDNEAGSWEPSRTDVGGRPELPLAAERRAWPPRAPRGEIGVTVGSTPARALAVVSDSSAGVGFELGELWRRLAACEWRVRDTFENGGRLYAVVEELPGRRRARRDGGLAMIEQVVLGQSSKAVAIDRQVTDSTVACAIRHRLRRMGLTCRVRAFPLILVMAARAARLAPPASVLGRVTPLGREEATVGRDASGPSFVISVEHPEFHLPAELSDAERAVLFHVLGGKSYGQVAAARRTSRRTVANQLASVFRKLGVSGYGQTLDFLMKRALGSTAAPPRRESLPRITLRSSLGARLPAQPH